MRRRDFICGAVSAAAAGSHISVAAAYQTCQATAMGAVCEAGISHSRIPTIYASQRMSQWCWAASLAMVFRYYGYLVPQEQIVQDVYGRQVNLPAFSGSVISSQLSRDWTDQEGRQFRVTLDGLFDADAGMVSINNQQIVRNLAADRPLLMGNTTHAVLLVSVAYFAAPGNPNIFNIGVLDPWPGIGARGAQHPAELVPMPMGGALRYLALPKVLPL